MADKRMISRVKNDSLIGKLRNRAQHHGYHLRGSVVWIRQYEPQMRLGVWSLLEQKSTARADDIHLGVCERISEGLGIQRVLDVVDVVF